jgi:hypothetical protein
MVTSRLEKVMAVPTLLKNNFESQALGRIAGGKDKHPVCCQVFFWSDRLKHNYQSHSSHVKEKSQPFINYPKAKTQSDIYYLI